MASKGDWRRMGQEKYLMEANLQYVEKYIPYSETWEHEHCCFCFAKIGAYNGDLYTGYCTTDYKKSNWICLDCFNDFKDEFKWRIHT